FCTHAATLALAALSLHDALPISSWVGDMVMAQTLFTCLKQQYPDCQIDVLAPEWSRPILERMPEVREALSFPLGHGVLELGTRRRIGKSLKGRYDQAILLPNSLKSALV